MNTLIKVALIGLIAWAVGYFVPMPPKIKTLVYVLAGIIALLVVLHGFGVDTGIQVPK